MSQKRHHYEQAFEACLRARRAPYVGVHEAHRALLPVGAAAVGGGASCGALKSFDFMVYSEPKNLLVDVKGRKIPRRRGGLAGAARGRLENWVTAEDVEALGAWGRLFGEAFEPAFVFMYWCDEQPPDGLFQEVFAHGDRWYAMRWARLEAYREAMRPRSPRWGTVHVPARRFEAISAPFRPVAPGPSGGAAGGTGSPLQRGARGVSSIA